LGPYKGPRAAWKGVKLRLGVLGAH